MWLYRMVLHKIHVRRPADRARGGASCAAVTGVWPVGEGLGASAAAAVLIAAGGARRRLRRLTLSSAKSLIEMPHYTPREDRPTGHRSLVQVQRNVRGGLQALYNPVKTKTKTQGRRNNKPQSTQSHSQYPSPATGIAHPPTSP